MLNGTVVYNFMTVKQLGKRVYKIKKKLDKETKFEKRLDLLEDLAVIVVVLLRRNRNNNEVMNYAGTELDKLKALVK